MCWFKLLNLNIFKIEIGTPHQGCKKTVWYNNNNIIACAHVHFNYVYTMYTIHIVHIALNSHILGIKVYDKI